MSSVLVRAVLVASFAGIGVQAVNAADLPPQTYRAPAVLAAPTFTWTGFYIGVNGGYGWGDGSDLSTLTGNSQIVAITLASGHMNGPVAGGQIGYNWQSGALVLGVEADGQWSGQKADANFECGAGCTFTESFRTEWFSTVRGRIGAAFDRLLIYGTGGVLFSDVSLKISASIPGAGNLSNISHVEVGWVAGVGVEYAITNNVSARAEYLYLDAGNVTLTGPFSTAFGGGTINSAAVLRTSMARGAINFRF